MILLLWIGLVLAKPVGLQADVGVARYVDDNDLQVTHPWVELTQQVSNPVQVNAGFQADVISAATVDVISAATKPFTERRKQGSLNLLGDFDRVRGSVGYAGSWERDTSSQTLQASGQYDVLPDVLTLGLGYGYNGLRLGDQNEPRELWDPRSIHQIDASVTRVVNPRTVVVAAYTLQLMSGDLTNPYLQVPVFPTDETRWTRDQAQWVDPRLPPTRGRHALTLSGRRALSNRVFVRGLWRGYLDSWSMRAHTGELGGGFDLGRGVTVEVSDRLHWQSRASFQRAVYTVNRDYLSTDRRLGEQIKNVSVLTLRPRRGQQLELLLQAELHYTNFIGQTRMLGDSPEPFPDIVALVAQTGMRWRL